MTTISIEPEKRSGMARMAVLSYGLVCYAVFFATFLYAIGFIGGFGVPKTLDGAATGSLVGSVLINLGLLALFAVQHSVMARPAFKQRWCTVVPRVVERSTYVLFSSLALIVLFICWQPMGGEIWTINMPLGRAALWTGYAFGWLLVLASTFLINHFDLFGLRQVWFAFRDEPYQPLKFVTPWPYRVIRHPLYLGWLMVIWCTPTMTIAHFLFALMTTAYIFIGIRLEENDLVKEHPDYADYKRRVPMIVPGLARRAATGA